MSRPFRVGRAALVVLLAATVLTGCRFIGDLTEGQRLTAERLGVDSALRGLTTELEQLDGVESADYSFDAADVSSRPGIWVEFASTDFVAWDRVVSRIAEVGDGDAMSGYSIDARLDAPSLTTSFSTPSGTGWFSEESLAIAADAASVFPGSRVQLSDQSESSATIYLSVTDSAEDLLTRMADDPLVVQLIGRAHDGRHWLSVNAPGLELYGTASPQFAGWAREVLAADVPRMAWSEGEVQEEWVYVSLSDGGETPSIAATWAGAAEPGDGGAAWDAFVAALRSGSKLTSGDPCVFVSLSYNWRGMGNSASVMSACAIEVTASSADRPAYTALIDALAAEGIVLEELGFALA